MYNAPVETKISTSFQYIIALAMDICIPVTITFMITKKFYLDPILFDYLSVILETMTWAAFSTLIYIAVVVQVDLGT